MDLDEEETIATDDDDSGEADQSFYLSRLMLTEHQFSSPTVLSRRVLSEEISPQIDLQYRIGQSRKTSTAKQQTHGTMVPPTNPASVKARNIEEESSSEKQHSEGFSGDGIIDRKSGKVLTLKSIHRQNHFGETKLHLTVMKGDIQDVKDLITVGASVNTPDYAGWTPLHEAVQRNKYDVTEILLKAGAEVNCRGANGITPLHDAIDCQYYKIVDLLLKYGADPLSKCDRGKTPMDMTTNTSVYILVEKYLQKSKNDPAENQPSTTDSAVNPSMSQRTSQNSIKDTRAPLQKSTGTADTSEHESSLPSGEAEPIPGPSRGQPSCDPSIQASFKVEPQTSTNVLWPMRDQEQDFCSQGPSLVQVQESEGSDTSSCIDSDVTVDYIEDYSSSPELWTLCATQDFSGS